MSAEDAPDVSVVIVSFNTRDALRRCLRELRSSAQRIRLEVLVVDNASRDASADMVEQEFPNVQLLRSDTNLGFGNANNLAFRQARGRYIVLLNSDAFPQAGALDKAVAHMDRESDVGIGGARLVDPVGGWQPSARQFPSLLNEVLNLSGLAARFPHSRFFGRFDRTWANPEQAADVDWVPGAFSIVRRSVLEQVGDFDPRFFLYYEEVDLCRRFKQAGYRVCYWPDIVVVHIGGESSKTVSDLAMSKAGSQLSLWRMRSEFLYYRKWHGGLSARLALEWERAWHRLRAWRNRRRDPVKANESQNLIALLMQAWRETRGGRESPPQPW